MNTSTNMSRSGFSLGYRILHWSMAVLILLMFMALVGFNPELSMEERAQMLVGHSSIGSIITLLLIVRIAKRFIKRDPVPEQSIEEWQKKASHFAHIGLYLLMIIVPVTGYLTANMHQLPVMVFGSFQINDLANYNEQAFLNMRSIHEISIYLLMALIATHVGAAFYHRLIKKDDVLQTMTKGTVKDK